MHTTLTNAVIKTF